MANAIWGLQLGENNVNETLTYLSIHHFTIYLPILSLLSYLTAPKPLWDRFTSLNCDDLSQNAMGILKTTPECFVIMDRIFSNIESLNPCNDDDGNDDDDDDNDDDVDNYDNDVDVDDGNVDDDDDDDVDYDNVEDVDYAVDYGVGDVNDVDDKGNKII